MKVISVNDPILLRVALRVLREGGVVAFPTETSYGLGGDWTNPKVHMKVRRIKQRPQGKPLSVIVASRSMAERYVVFSPVARRLARHYWPGPLSLVLPLKRASSYVQTTVIPAQAGIQTRKNKNRAGLFVFVSGSRVKPGMTVNSEPRSIPTLSLRISPHPIAHKLVCGLDKPLIATSANVSGTQALYSASATVRAFSGKKFKPDLVIDGGTLLRRKPSTVVQVNTDGSVRVLRVGSLRLNVQ
ncbi:MAG: L-threonylcarbamoyladenylate synthase [Patescibacteria group bacterium]